LVRGLGAGSIFDDEKRRLEALSLDKTKSPKQILNELAEINKDIGARSNGKISAGCWVVSVYKDETDVVPSIRYMAWNSGGKAGNVLQILNQQDIFESFKKHIPQLDFSKAKLVQIAGASHGRWPKKTT
jgi:hypothetical protein